MDFQARVADHYRSRGYQVRTGTRVRGASGNVYAVDLVAQGPLGNIVLTFGGTDGLDEADVAHIKRVAKEVGATPVAASASVDPVVRRLAGRESVVVLDDDLPEAVQEPDVVPDDDVKRWAEDHPWPGSERQKASALQTSGLDDLLGGDTPEEEPPAKVRPEPPVPSERPKERFSWLQQSTGSQGGYAFAEARPVTVQADAPTRVARESRDEVLRHVRERVERSSTPVREPVEEAHAAPPADVPARAVHAATPEWVWILRFSVTGIVGAAVLWVLLRFS